MDGVAVRVLLQWVPLIVSGCLLSWHALNTEHGGPHPQPVVRLEGALVNPQVLAARRTELTQDAARAADALKVSQSEVLAESGLGHFSEIRDLSLIDPEYLFDGECKWLQTEGCTPHGKLNGWRTLACHDEVPPNVAGICQCSDRTLYGKACHSRGTVMCAQVCSKQRPAFPGYTELLKYRHGAAPVAGAFVSLAPSRSFYPLCRTLRSMTRTMAAVAAQYPIILIHDPHDKFSDSLRRGVRHAAEHSTVRFVSASSRLYDPPSSINLTKLAGIHKATHKSTSRLYAKHMAQSRYMTGLFMQESFMDGIEYVMKFETGMLFLCSVPYDPFVMMKVEGKAVGFSLMYHDSAQEMPTLGLQFSNYHKLHPDPAAGAMLSQLFRDNIYTGCSFGASFLMLSLDWLRSPKYSEFFATLDVSGGFFYDGWQYHPTMTALAAVLAPPEQWYYFESVAVSTHSNGFHLPTDLLFCNGQPVTQRNNPGMNDWRHPCLQSFAHYALLANRTSPQAAHAQPRQTP